MNYQFAAAAGTIRHRSGRRCSLYAAENRASVGDGMPTENDWLEYAKLGVAALTPIVTGLIGLIVLRLGSKVEATKQLNQELLRKRLHLFEEIAPKLNDIHCFYQAVGHWTELNPEEIIRRKRAIDRAIQVNRYLFHSDFWAEYQRFEQAHFEMFSAPGQPARLRLDLDHVGKRAGAAFKDDWLPSASTKPGSHEEQVRHYQALMEILGREIRGG
jgi:hypothetical protein